MLAVPLGGTTPLPDDFRLYRRLPSTVMIE